MFKIEADLFFCFFNLFYVEIGISVVFVALDIDVPGDPAPWLVLFVHKD